jgi:hypothetical protein
MGSGLTPGFCREMEMTLISVFARLEDPRSGMICAK